MYTFTLLRSEITDFSELRTFVRFLKLKRHNFACEMHLYCSNCHTGPTSILLFRWTSFLCLTVFTQFSCFALYNLLLPSLFQGFEIVKYSLSENGYHCRE